MVISLLQYIAYVTISVWLVILTHIYYAYQTIILPNAGVNPIVLTTGQDINKIGNLTSSIFNGN